jgi:outer membrane protein assembly factor BamB
MPRSPSIRCCLAALLSLAAGVLLAPGRAEPAQGKKHALLVGVRDYDSSKFDPLKYTQNDAEELARVLEKQAGFSVRVLTTSRGAKNKEDAPALETLRAAIKGLLAGKKRDDTVLIALAGHGMQAAVKEGGREKEESFFCPSDAAFSDPRTLLSLSKLFADLDGCDAGVKLLLVDACRNDPGSGRNVNQDNLRPPRGIAALFSCKSGERAFETPKLGGGHGVFFHHVIEGLRGKAKNKRGEVTWSTLADYVTESVSDEVPKLIGGGAKQTPEQKLNLTGKSPVLIDPARVEVVKGWNWEEKPPRLLWRQPCGGGFAGFAVASNVAVTVEQRRGQEAVVCYDRVTGHMRWVHAYDARFHHLTGDGPRATPTIADGEVYSLGATGVLCCLDGVSGKRKWSVNILEDNRAKCVSWGMTSSPLVAGELVIVNPGIDPDRNAEQSLAAYRRSDGKRVWAAGSFKAGYSSPQKARLAGRDQVVIFDAGGLVGRDLDSGKKLWRHKWETPRDMSITQPLLLSGDRVFLSSETTNGCALLKVTRQGDDFAVEPVWANRNLCAMFANPVALGGAIYGMSNEVLVCIDQQTGERHWRGKRYGRGQVLAANGAILVLGERGELAVVAADPRRFQELARLEVFKERTWNAPTLAGRHLFLRNAAEMACFELPVGPP